MSFEPPETHQNWSVFALRNAFIIILKELIKKSGKALEEGLVMRSIADVVLTSSYGFISLLTIMVFIIIQLNAGFGVGINQVNLIIILGMFLFIQRTKV